MPKSLHILPVSSRMTKRRLITAPVPAVGAAENWAGGVGLGSFAYLGHNVSRHAPARDPKLYLAVEVGERCQLQCRHCIYHREEPHRKEPLPLVEQELTESISHGLDPLWVSFAGKEPTLFPEHLLRQAASVRRPGRTNILMTNGLKLYGGFLDRLAEVIDYFDISVDGDEAAHDWMRGNGMFRRTWRNIGAVLEQTDRHVGIIATLVHARLSTGRLQHEDLAALASRLQSTFGNSGRVTLSVSLYYGPPDDPLQLGTDDIAALLEDLLAIDFPSRVLVTAHYAHIWPEVCAKVGLSQLPVEYDVPTGFALLRHGRVSCVLFNSTACRQVALRLSNEGRVFLSCNHLTLGDEGVECSIGDVQHEHLHSLAAKAMLGQTRFAEALGLMPAECRTCDRWDACLGGDRLSGMFFDGIPADPYCKRIERCMQ